MNDRTRTSHELGDDPESNYDLFVSQVLESGQVWGLKNDDGWALCDSVEFEETDVFPFWSSEKHAAGHCEGEWKIYDAATLSLDEFLEDWLPGMHEDGAMVGPNWDGELNGLEVEPRDLAERLGGLESQE
jgi:hypothetical protein